MGIDEESSEGLEAVDLTNFKGHPIDLYLIRSISCNVRVIIREGNKMVFYTPRAALKKSEQFRKDCMRLLEIINKQEAQRQAERQERLESTAQILEVEDFKVFVEEPNEDLGDIVDHIVNERSCQ